MYCIECGKQNPDGAKFCAFCGKRLFTGEQTQPETAQEAIKTENPAAPKTETANFVPEAPVQTAHAPEQPSERPKTQENAYARPPRYKTLQPLAENPAQPEREFDRPAFSAAVPSVFETKADGPSVFENDDPSSAADDIAEYDDGEAAPEPPFSEGEPLWAAPNQPDEDWWGDDEPEPEAESDTPAEKKKFVFPWQRNKEENMVLTADGEEEMPARKPVISRKRRDTRVPERIVKQPEPEQTDEDMDEEREDIFFMRPKKPRRAPEEDTLDDAYVNGRVRSILFGIAFVLCLSAAVWLFATNSGQMFLAGFNLSSDAQAYRDLGDSARANNQIKRAAEAYYKALSLDPDDYETALLVGRTQQQIGEYDTAANAYYLCTQLMPTQIEPYEALVQLYEIQNEPEKADYFRELGLINAGVIIE